MNSGCFSQSSRRTWLGRTAALLAGLAVAPRSWAADGSPFKPEDDQLLEELEQASFRFFRENMHPRTGLVKDRCNADGPDNRDVASIAATGFGLAALCIADKRKYLPRGQAKQQVLNTLRFLIAHLPNQRGFYFHFVHWASGARVWQSELSSIDTALLLAGVLACRYYFNDKEIEALAKRLYERVDWPWMLNGAKTFSHGWKPESGFLTARWDTYSEHMILNLLAIGSPTHPVPADTWEAWRRPWYEYAGFRYINSPGSLFTHQFSHAWIDFRNQNDKHTDYFKNSIAATRAHRAWCLSLRNESLYGEPLWGVTASDTARGYKDWGGPPGHGDVDGSIVPCATAGSLPFLPNETMEVQRFLRKSVSQVIWKRYGFVDAFNPLTDWVNPDVIGIDVGISLVMAENARSSFVWEQFMLNEEIGKAMKQAGFKFSSEVPVATPPAPAAPIIVPAPKKK